MVPCALSLPLKNLEHLKRRLPAQRHQTQQDLHEDGDDQADDVMMTMMMRREAPSAVKHLNDGEEECGGADDEDDDGDDADDDNIIEKTPTNCCNTSQLRLHLAPLGLWTSLPLCWSTCLHSNLNQFSWLVRCCLNQDSIPERNVFL